SAPTASPPTATWPTRSAPTPLPCWPKRTTSPSTSPHRSRPWISSWPQAMPSPLSSAAPRKSRICKAWPSPPRASRWRTRRLMLLPTATSARSSPRPAWRARPTPIPWPRSPMPPLRQLLAEAAARLQSAGVAQSRLTAELLLAHALGRERSYLYAHPEETPDPASFLDLIARRVAGEPMQYLTGVQEFFGRSFAVSPAVLIPRPETELVIAAALELIPGDAPARIADVGTGSGCLAVTLALERPRATVFATDISSAAMAVARQN